ncbi:MAG TPA: beta-galactosidase, partial [Fimbriimonadaceae bacterium]|nr:beta-galactosidase [Fimbriimonadaceae bacterium]
SDDPVFIQWSKHWYDAVAKVVVKHELTHEPVGAHGVILWQVENEYSFSGDSDEVTSNYVRALIKMSQQDGIDVPIFTCWTGCVRDHRDDPLLGQAWDNPNLYPRWNVDDIVGALNDQHRAQPDAPKMVTELQGGWFGQVGGLQSDEQDGISAAQIQALTLLGIQDGMAGSNYYMLFGGTNLGDWAAENITTSYDYFAPIREWGGVGDKYRAVQAIGQMLQKYGPDIVRAGMIDSPYAPSDPNVKVGARKGKSGATYLFVRNTDRNNPASGDLGPIHYELGPFGSNVYRYADDPAKGEWLVEPANLGSAGVEDTRRGAIRIDKADMAIAQPTGWRKAPKTPTVENLGIYDSRFVFYRAQVGAGDIWMRTPGGELIGNLPGAGVSLQGGRAWQVPAGEIDLTLLNPGWPNGGRGMEDARGVGETRLLKEMPQGVALRGWRGKPIPDENDRSLTAENVETEGWTSDIGNRLFPPHSTAVIRTTADLGANPNKDLLLSTAGIDDEGWFYVNGHLVGELHQWGVPAEFRIGQFVHPGANSVAVVIHNNDGDGGISGPMSIESPLPPSSGHVTWEWTDQTAPGAWTSYALDTAMPLTANEHPRIEGPRPSGPPQVRSRVKFDRPVGKDVAWEMVIEAGGDGFLYLNGQPLGRYWERGPQRGFYLPDSMLKDENELELVAVPGRLGDRIKAAELRPLPMRS